MSNAPTSQEDTVRTPTANTVPGNEGDIRSRVIPYEQRESQNPKLADYLKSSLSVFGYLLLGGVAGGIVGKSLESKNIGFGPFQRYGQMFSRSGKVDTQMGATLGIKVGFFVGIYRAWKEVEGKRIGVKEINGDLMSAMDSSQLATEVKREEAILEDLHVIQSRLEQNTPLSHAEREKTRRTDAQALQL